MLVRYYVTDKPAVVRDRAVAERAAHYQRIELFSTFSGGLILLAMLATLMLLQA